jgi:hypothetical protein
MKRISSILLLSLSINLFAPLCIAQNAPQAAFSELKTKLIAVTDSGISMMTQSKMCFEKVNDKSAFNQCKSAMPEDLKRDVIDRLSPPNVLNRKSASAQSLTYSQETNLKIVEYLQSSINITHDLKQCINGSTTPDQFTNCVNTPVAGSTNNPPPAVTNLNDSLSPDR